MSDPLVSLALSVAAVSIASTILDDKSLDRFFKSSSLQSDFLALGFWTFCLVVLGPILGRFASAFPLVGTLDVLDPGFF